MDTLSLSAMEEKVRGTLFIPTTNEITYSKETQDSESALADLLTQKQLSGCHSDNGNLMTVNECTQDN